MDLKIVYANSNCVVAMKSGDMYSLKIGMTADSDQPLVLERPDLFQDELPMVTLAGPARLAAEREQWADTTTLGGHGSARTKR
jgi:hypothetical protein